jgi:hypothetical protein
MKLPPVGQQRERPAIQQTPLYSCHVLLVDLKLSFMQLFFEEAQPLFECNSASEGNTTSSASMAAGFHFTACTYGYRSETISYINA